MNCVDSFLFFLNAFFLCSLLVHQWVRLLIIPRIRQFLLFRLRFVRLLRGRFGHRGSQVGFLLLFLNLNGL